MQMIPLSTRDAQEVKDVLEAELQAVAYWIEQNHLKMNVSKTQLMVLSRRHRRHEAEQICIQHDGSMLVSEEKVRYLGVDIDRNLTWKDQVHKIRQSCLGSLAKLSRVRSFLPLETKKKLYNALILPYRLLLCCLDGLWGNPEPQNRKTAKLWDAVNHILTTTGL